MRDGARGYCKVLSASWNEARPCGCSRAERRRGSWRGRAQAAGSRGVGFQRRAASGPGNGNVELRSMHFEECRNERKTGRGSPLRLFCRSCEGAARCFRDARSAAQSRTERLLLSPLPCFLPGLGLTPRLDRVRWSSEIKLVFPARWSGSERHFGVREGRSAR